MKLDSILQESNAFIFMERYVDEAVKNYSAFAGESEAAPDYQPGSAQSSFQLVTIHAPRSHVSIFEANPTTSLRDHYVDAKEVLFAVHPETWASPGVEHIEELQALPRGKPIEVAPTASTRTVLTVGTSAQAVPAHFLKLHYPRRISRFNRRLRRKNIRKSVESSRDMEHIRLDRFAYLPEVLGFTYGHDRDDWGFLIRETTPRPSRKERFLIPYFALYAKDMRDPASPPLLVQLIERLGVDPESFVLEEIMIPVVDCWTKVVRERGILLESHAQNLLLEIDRDFRPHRTVHRDFDVWIDREVRKRAGLEAIGADIEVHESFPRQYRYSLVYDHYLGRELFSYLLDILVRFYAVKERQVRGRISDAFHRSFPDARIFFPSETTYYYSNAILARNKFRLIDMQQAPDWR